MWSGGYGSFRRWAIAPAALVIVSMGLVGCAGSTPSVSAPGVSGVSGLSSRLDAWRLGASPGSSLSSFGGLRQAPSASRVRSRHGSIPQALYISDLVVPGGGVLVFDSKTFEQLGTISDGTSAADGLWVDEHGDLYAANANGGNVTEYAPGATSPKCTYSRLIDAVNVTTDRHGHVFAVDWNFGSKGSIVEYKHCKDKIVRRYNFPKYKAPAGAAVDAAGNLFVAYYAAKASPSQQGEFEEFPAGSKTPQKLSATVIFPGSILLDKSGNLIVADQGIGGESNGAVDVIAPPYTAVTPLQTGLAQPVHLSLNKKQTLLYANSFNFADPTVWVMSYPSGTMQTTLGSANGLAYPLGVAASPNAVF